MKLKLDENLPNAAVELFCQAGHDVQSVRMERFSGISDQDLINLCRREGRVLVTLDMEFANPFLFPPTDYPGIAVLRLPPHPTYEDILQVCQTLIHALDTKCITGKLWSISARRVREYQTDNSNS
jgi:predicted nuclease of predicted toxin-antitoxin system